MKIHSLMERLQMGADSSKYAKEFAEELRWLRFAAMALGLAVIIHVFRGLLSPQASWFQAFLLFALVFTCIYVPLKLLLGIAETLVAINQNLERCGCNATQGSTPAPNKD